MTASRRTDRHRSERSNKLSAETLNDMLGPEKNSVQDFCERILQNAFANRSPRGDWYKMTVIKKIGQKKAIESDIWTSIHASIGHWLLTIRAFYRRGPRRSWSIACSARNRNSKRTRKHAWNAWFAPSEIAFRCINFMMTQKHSGIF